MSDPLDVNELLRQVTEAERTITAKSALINNLFDAKERAEEACAILREERDQALDVIQQVCEALMFYADEKQYGAKTFSDRNWGKVAPVMHDCGERARDALTVVRDGEAKK